MKRKLSDDTEIALRQLADQLATESIVHNALARYLFQILEYVSEEYIEPQRARIAELEHQVRVLGGKV